MRGMQERATASRGDLLDAFRVFVALVEVQVAGQKHARLAPEHLLFEEAGARLLFVARVARIGIFENPARLGHAEDEARSVIHARGDLLEVLHLRFVEIGTELQVDGQQPPVGGKLEREIAARLPRGTTGETALGPAERARERDQAVVPVVVARDREHVGARPAREREFVRRFGARVVLGTRGIRIDLVATEHQHSSALSLYRCGAVLNASSGRAMASATAKVGFQPSPMSAA